ncbi:MAG: hypothetical protein R2712_15025 [Vicinamibacterales bacterium]
MKQLTWGLALAAGMAVGGYALQAQGAAQANPQMSFFITSVGSGNGANLGGLAGADAHCQNLAKAVGAGNKEWHAYLSTQGPNAVNAKDRIGPGPWFNSKGVQIASSVADLHRQEQPDEGDPAHREGHRRQRRGDTPNQHDILTGSNLDGTAYAAGEDHTCSNWTSQDAGSANVGHHDRQGGGANPNSWNNAHASKGCSQQNLIATGGNGYYYVSRRSRRLGACRPGGLRAWDREQGWPAGPQAFKPAKPSSLQAPKPSDPTPRAPSPKPLLFPLIAVTSISIFIRGSDRPASIIVAAGRTSPKASRSAGQQRGKSAADGRM